MKKNVVIFDGNKKFFFGGGQRVTLDVIDSVKDDFNIYLVEVERSDEFFQRCAGSYSKCIRLSGPIFTDLYRVFSFMRTQNLSPQNTIIYSAAKRSHVISFFLKLYGYRTILHLHSINPKQSVFYYITKICYLFADVVITPSRFVAQYYQLLNGKLIYNSVKAIPDGSKLSEKKTFIVAFIGSIEEFKGVRLFCEASEMVSGAEFWVIGEGSLINELSSSYPHVQFKGFLEDISDLLNTKISLLVLPTLIPEAFGLVIAEAMTCGVPVVTSNIGAQRELLEKFQVEGLFQVGNLNSLHDAIIRLQHPVAYESYRKKIRTAKEVFSFINFRNDVLGVFNKLYRF